MDYFVCTFLCWAAVPDPNNPGSLVLAFLHLTENLKWKIGWQDAKWDLSFLEVCDCSLRAAVQNSCCWNDCIANDVDDRRLLCNLTLIYSPAETCKLPATHCLRQLSSHLRHVTLTVCRATLLLLTFCLSVSLHFISALHGMPVQTSGEKGVRLSVCPDFYTIRKII